MTCRFEVSETAADVTGNIDLGNPTPLGVSGGYASVWRAGRHGEYAIKSFHDAGEDSARQEYEFLVMLNDAGCHCIPKAVCLGTFVDGDGVRHSAFVEQYIDGKSLARVLEDGTLSGDARDHTLGAVPTALIALELAKALEAIAERGLAHRDLSANNVMLTARCVTENLQRGAEVYLVDFGQSTATDKQTATPVFPRLATIPYGAPEIYGGDHYLERNSEKCDTWSLGALICTMIVGEYWPEEIEDLRTRIVTPEDLQRISDAKRTPISLSSLLTSTGKAYGDVERGLADIVSACTNYNPVYRPALKDVIRDLEDIIKQNVKPSISILTPDVENEDQIDGDNRVIKITKSRESTRTPTYINQLTKVTSGVLMQADHHPLSTQTKRNGPKNTSPSKSKWIPRIGIAIISIMLCFMLFLTMNPVKTYYVSVNGGMVAIFISTSADAIEVSDVAVANLSTDSTVKLLSHISAFDLENARDIVDQFRKEASDNNETKVSEHYILPESNSRLYTYEELNNLTDWELWMGRNEIYARHGRMFNDQEAQQYFDSQTWYIGRYKPSDYDKNVKSRVQNTYENANVSLIKQIESERDTKYPS